MIELNTRGVRFVGILLAVMCVLILATPAGPSAQTQKLKVVYAGTLIDGVSGSVHTNVSVIVADDRIREVRSGKAVVPGAKIIDLSDSTVMPGFIDCHTHVTFQLDKDRTLKDLVLRRNSELTIDATTYARETLLAGFTTVRDVRRSELHRRESPQRY